jgi:Alanine-zipper, major outer membrane lipoprotein
MRKLIEATAVAASLALLVAAGTGCADKASAGPSPAEMAATRAEQAASRAEAAATRASQAADRAEAAASKAEAIFMKHMRK